MNYAVKPGKTWAKEVKTMSFLHEHAVLTTQEAIKYLRIFKPTYLKYIHLGRIKPVKAGTGWRIHRSELRRFLEAYTEQIQI